MDVGLEEPVSEAPASEDPLNVSSRMLMGSMAGLFALVTGSFLYQWRKSRLKQQVQVEA